MSNTYVWCASESVSAVDTSLGRDSERARREPGMVCSSSYHSGVGAISTPSIGCGGWFGEM